MQRRHFLAGTTALASLGLAGCLDAIGGSGSAEAPDPVDLSGGKFDDQGEMEIGPHGGANGQIFYEDEVPEGRVEGPFWFHTLVFGLFPHYFDHTDRGWDIDVAYVTDFSAVEYEIQEREGMAAMPSPTAPETFADATDLTYVVESDVMGGMGPDLHPFSDVSEADSFVDEHGGRTVEFDEIGRELIETLRERDHDQQEGS